MNKIEVHMPKFIWKIDATKVIVALAAMICATILGGEGALPLITLVAGYILGNSRSTRSGDFPAAAVEPHYPKDPNEPQ